MREDLKKKKNILVVGGGGREHAIVDAISRSPQAGKIYCAPGNAGIATLAECVDIKVEDMESLARFAKDNDIDLTVVGPEAALAVGIVNKFQNEGLRIFGPTKEAAQIESSKEFAKRLMEKYDIPTGSYKTFTDYESAKEYVLSRPLPAVIKYDGLAAGKGVVVASTYEEADSALKDMLLDASFGEGKVIVEEYLAGPEFSFMAIVSGENVCPLAIAQDHKRAYDNDEGPNTGGMGAYSPVPFITDDVRGKALDEVLIPAARGMVAEGVPFTGVLYGGLILTNDGPKVIEFNARFGDPETEVVLPRLESDIVEMFESAVDGKPCEAEWSKDACLGVVLASKGYPGSYEKGAAIEGLDSMEGTAYHMGTKMDASGNIVTAGGRVLMVTGRGKDLQSAHAAAMADVERIRCSNLFHRTDIGKQSL